MGQISCSRLLYIFLGSRVEWSGEVRRLVQPVRHTIAITDLKTLFQPFIGLLVLPRQGDEYFKVERVSLLMMK